MSFRRAFFALFQAKEESRLKAVPETLFLALLKRRGATFLTAYGRNFEVNRTAL